MDFFQHRTSTAVGHVHVEQHHIRTFCGDPHNGFTDGARFSHDGNPVIVQPRQLGLDTGAEEGVIINQKDGNRA